jgi:hypothetical protein
MNLKPVVVVTARGGSVRLPNKNQLPIGGVQLFQWSIIHAKSAGLDVIVTSDVDEILAKSKAMGAITVKRPQGLANGSNHYEAIRHAVSIASQLDSSIANRPVMLLQPTSPFRNRGIVEKCIEGYNLNPDRVVMSGSSIHVSDLNGNKVENDIWDGCVAIYPPDMIGPPNGAAMVRNDYGNGLQIDSEADYLEACARYYVESGKSALFNAKAKAMIGESMRSLFGKNITLVGRPDGLPIDQSHPVAYLNHCRGYGGGRADILFIIDCPNIRKLWINPEVLEVANKASLIVVRDLKRKGWVKRKLNMPHKTVTFSNFNEKITSGAMASMTLGYFGAKVQRVGFQSGVARLPYLRSQFKNGNLSDELAMLYLSGTDRVS